MDDQRQLGGGVEGGGGEVGGIPWTQVLEHLSGVPHLSEVPDAC